MTASGDVVDYTADIREEIIKSFASAAGVAQSRVSLTVQTASVLLTVTIAAQSEAEAQAAQHALSPLLVSKDAATALLPKGFTVESSPEITVAAAGTTSPPSPDIDDAADVNTPDGIETPDTLAIIAGGSIGLVALLGFICLSYIYLRHRRTPHSRPSSPRVFPNETRRHHEKHSNDIKEGVRRRVSIEDYPTDKKETPASVPTRKPPPRITRIAFDNDDDDVDDHATLGGRKRDVESHDDDAVHAFDFEEHGGDSPSPVSPRRKALISAVLASPAPVPAGAQVGPVFFGGDDDRDVDTSDTDDLHALNIEDHGAGALSPLPIRRKPQALAAPVAAGAQVAPVLADILSGDDDAPSPRWSMTELRASPRRQMPGSRALPRMALPESRAVWAPPSAPVLANIFDDESDAPSPRRRMPESGAVPLNHPPAPITLQSSHLPVPIASPRRTCHRIGSGLSALSVNALPPIAQPPVRPAPSAPGAVNDDPESDAESLDLDQLFESADCTRRTQLF